MVHLAGFRMAALGLLAALVLSPLSSRPANAAEVTPASVQRAVDQLDRIVDDALRRTGVPGVALAVVHRDRIVALKGYGVRDTTTGAPVGIDTVFQLASVSKPVGSTVVASLVGDGIVGWDSRIVDLDPTFRMHEEWVTAQLTIRDLYSHRSGLPDHAGDDLEDLGYGREEILRRLRFLPPAYQFRSGYNYTNFGMTEAAVAAAKAAGRSWEDLSAERLYRPLGMTRTSSRFADFATAPDRALTHVRVGDRWEPRFVRNPDAQSPAGGVSSTARDLAQWLRLQLGNGEVDGRRIVGAEALAETHRPQAIAVPPANPATDHPQLYGLGWNVGSDAAGRVRLSHSGAFALGAATVVVLLPSEELGIVVLTNGEPVGVPEAIAASFFDVATEGRVQRDYVSLYGRIFAEALAPAYGRQYDYSQPPVAPAPARPLGAYVGRYVNDYVGVVELGLGSEGLELRLGPLQAPFALRHWDGDIFLYQPAGENAAGPARVVFSAGIDGRIETVTIENLNITGGGVLRRVSAIG
ncbi:MAG: serine hydrolase [Dehalococcoidia bacterium]|nr:MAG: serine hydrolase [Dehalococcoidia bacterium]